MSIGDSQGRTVQSIAILDRIITARSSTGAGIGRGFSSSGNRLEIQGGELNAESVLGAGDN
jgi:hypothetical protein